MNYSWCIIFALIYGRCLMKFLSVCFAFLFAHIAAAAPFVLNETIPCTLNANDNAKEIKLLKVNLSRKNRAALKAEISSILHTSKRVAPLMSHSRALPSHVQLGMNDVPVLDQGQHGTCVTFAATAALDALIGRGDYISQLCLLNLGNFIGNHTLFRPSGWDGSYASITLARLSEYGIVSKEYEKMYGCGGVTQYPKDNPFSPENEMTIEDYHHAHLRSVPFFEGEHFIQTELLNFQQRMTNQESMDNIQSNVKKALYQGDRVLIGVLLPMNEWIGLEGQFQAPHDAWVLTGRTEYLASRAISDPSQWGQWGGHEMIITGYDDEAIAVDGAGVAHKGLFTLRNSWGIGVGDQGDFYMSYDYFKALTLDLVRIGNLALVNG